jgi:hypothetical protein
LDGSGKTPQVFVATLVKLGARESSLTSKNRHTLCAKPLVPSMAPDKSRMDKMGESKIFREEISLTTPNL